MLWLDDGERLDQGNDAVVMGVIMSELDRMATRAATVAMSAIARGRVEVNVSCAVVALVVQGVPPRTISGTPAVVAANTRIQQPSLLLLREDIPR